MKPANSAAMRGKTARACDSCLKRRAQWFCAADDAFLCRGCDSSVHLANHLASRHLRVRINNYDSSSIVSTISTIADAQCLATPAWLQGFTRKARTPRAATTTTNNNKFVREDAKVLTMNPPLPRQLLVPQMEQEGNNTNNNIEEEEENELQCRVPVFDPCDINTDGNVITGFLDDLDTNDDFVEFAAGVESLLAAEEGHDDHQNPVKIKDEEAEEELGIANCYFSTDFEESLMGWDFDYDLPVIEDDDEEEEEEKKQVVEASNDSVIDTSGNLMTISNETQEEMRNISLRLNHEAVMAAWATQGSPWTTGSRSVLLNPNDYWLHCMETNMYCEQYGGVRGQMRSSTDDCSREARVSRYREKRRTRLFSKKIRYEVRKLNAEKRPRLKGRFVKRTTTTFLSFAGTSSPTNN